MMATDAGKSRLLSKRGEAALLGYKTPALSHPFAHSPARARPPAQMTIFKTCLLAIFGVAVVVTAIPHRKTTTLDNWPGGAFATFSL
jgi:hypothetical protein